MPKIATVLACSLVASALSFSAQHRSFADMAFILTLMVPAYGTVCRLA